MGHLALELAHTQAIQNQRQGLVVAPQIDLTKGLTSPWHQPSWIQQGLAMAIQAPAAHAEITKALLQLPPRLKTRPHNPAITPGRCRGQGRGGIKARGKTQRFTIDQRHRTAQLGELHGQQATG
jgi:hypothetical protein